MRNISNIILAFLMIFSGALLIACSGCYYPEPQEVVKPVRGPLHYYGPDITGERPAPPPVEEQVDEEPDGEAGEEESEEDEDTGDDRRSGGYFSILDWLPFERDLWGRPFNGVSEEPAADGDDNWAEWEPYMPVPNE